MKQLLTILFSVLLAIWFSPLATLGAEVRITSPSDNIKVCVADNDTQGITISVDAADGSGELQRLLLPSPIDLLTASSGAGHKLMKSSVKRGLHESVEAPFYRNRSFSTTWNEADIRLDKHLALRVRVYDDGVAYRFESSSKTPEKILDEVAHYRVAGKPEMYLAHTTNPENPMAMAFQNYYKVTPLDSMASLPAFLPSAADFGHGLKMTIMEADLESYPGMFLQPSEEGVLKGIFARYPKSHDYYPWRRQQYVTGREDYLARTDGARTFPWRILAITTDDTQMPVNNLVYALASPSRVEDPTWIKPGQSAWEWWNDWGLRNVSFPAGINNDTYKYFIDFASENGIPYVILDEGWYKPESGDMLTTIDDINLPELISYAGSKGVGLWLWTVFNVLDDQLEEACAKYSAMGVKGFKVDFLDRDDQEAVEMTYRIAEAAARHKLMLDLHGFYKPTGLNRTYPNIVNFESVFGMEELKWSDPSVDMPRYDVTFPYIRMMCGPVDFTPGAMRNASKADWRAVYSNPVSQGTRAHQVACYIVQDSPFTMLADSPSNYIDNQSATDFITSIPTVFDSTRILAGKMGEYIVTLRQNKDCWFAGGQTDWNPRDFELDFSFLPSAQDFKVTLLHDGMNATKQADDHIIESFTVNSGSRRLIRMAPGGGFALRIDPL